MRFFHPKFKTLFYILLVVFGLAVLIPLFHHHEEEDSQDHDNCLLCFYLAHHSDILLHEEQPFSHLAWSPLNGRMTFIKPLFISLPLLYIRAPPR